MLICFFVRPLFLTVDLRGQRKTAPSLAHAQRISNTAPISSHPSTISPRSSSPSCVSPLLQAALWQYLPFRYPPQPTCKLLRCVYGVAFRRSWISVFLLFPSNLPNFSFFLFQNAASSGPRTQSVHTHLSSGGEEEIEMDSVDVGILSRQLQGAVSREEMLMMIMYIGCESVPLINNYSLFPTLYSSLFFTS